MTEIWHFPVVSTLSILPPNNHIQAIAGAHTHAHTHFPASARIIACLGFDARHFNEKDSPYHCFHQASWSSLFSYFGLRSELCKRAFSEM